MYNRLRLNFSLETNIERVNFLYQYLQQDTFKKRPPTEEELSIMSDYLLWGKDTETGLNPMQDKSLQLDTIWTRTQNTTQSLDELLESPTFSEAQLVNDVPQTRIKKEKFSRSLARSTFPPEILGKLEDLWTLIDKIDLEINYYELAHGKRKKPPRESLLQKFSDEEQQQIKHRAQSINQFKYLKLRKLLRELYSEQFVLKDQYSTSIFLQEPQLAEPVDPPQFSSDIQCAPLSLIQNSKLSQLIFPKDGMPIPEKYNQSQLKQIIQFYWRHQKELNNDSFDFKNLEHVYETLLMFDSFQMSSQEKSSLNTTKAFLDTLKWYIDQADLTELQRELLDLKIAHKKNQDIAIYINQKYGKSYTANYISTIFRQKIIPAINTAAELHEQHILNLPYPENFKKCRYCGRTLLINENNFVHRLRSADGFSSQCKKCDKIRRDLKKNG